MSFWRSLIGKEWELISPHPWHHYLKITRLMLCYFRYTNGISGPVHLRSMVVMASCHVHKSPFLGGSLSRRGWRSHACKRELNLSRGKLRVTTLWEASVWRCLHSGSPGCIPVCLSRARLAQTHQVRGDDSRNLQLSMLRGALPPSSHLADVNSWL